MSSLFPIAANNATSVVNDGDKKDEETLDWLQNTSYVPVVSAAEQEENVEERQKEPRSLHHSSSDVSSDDVEMEVEMESLDEFETDEKPKQPHEKKKKKKKHKHKDKHKKKDSKSNQNEGEKTVRPFFSDKTFIEDVPGLKPEHAFRLDRKVEKNLWIYGSISELHLTKYRLATNYVIGADDGLRVSAVAKDGHSKQHKQKNHAERYFGKDNRKETRTLGQYIQPQQSNADTADFGECYIPLNNASARNTDARSSSVDPIGIMDHATAQYIEGKGVSSQDSSKTLDSEDVCFDETLQKVASYNRRLREDPGNVPLWLEFVQFQEKISGLGGKTQKLAAKLGEAQPRSRAMLEKQLTILDKALDANPGNINLKLAQLGLWEELWEPSKVDKEWEQMLFVHSGDGQLWRRYLLYQQSRLSTFSVSRMTKLYHKAFRTLLALLEGRKQAARIPHDLHQEMLYLFVQYCQFLWQSGHTEKAVASFQALLEFNLACPPSLQALPATDRVAVFECFWDSSVARIGEDGAQGWKLWAESKGENSAESPPPALAETEEAEDAVVSQGLPQWQTWLQIECLREAAHVLPWRPDLSQDQTVEDCEDLDRLVLFDDISPVLFPLKGMDEAFIVLMNFLRMLGLRTDHLLSCHGYSAQEVSTLVQLYDLPQAAVLDCGISLDRELKPHSVHISLIRNLLKQALGLFSGHRQTHLSLLLLQLEKWQVRGSNSCKGDNSGRLTKAQVKELRKFAKTLLKEEQNRNNLLVWNAYAELEAELGKREDAVGIVETALSMFSGNGPLFSKVGTETEDAKQIIQSLGLCTLHQTHAELVLNFHPDSAVMLQTQSASEPASESALLKAAAGLACLASGKRFLPGQSSSLSACQMLECQLQFKTLVSGMVDEVMQGSAAATRHELLLKLVNCEALFALCSSNLQEAVEVFADVVNRLNGPNVSSKDNSSLSVLRERLHQSQIHLITNVMSTTCVPLGILRAALDGALEAFPDSARLLQCFVQVEARSHIAGRLQRFFDRALRSLESPLPAIFAVVAFMVQLHVRTPTLGETTASELAASLPETGLVHRTRALFERGLQQPTCQHCPLVWRLYLAFEVQYGKRDRAKGVYYRALQHCPWAKELHKDGVRVFQDAELPEMVSLMTEKEIRVQIPLEEIEVLLETPVSMEVAS